jgi:hypothetical protein
MVKRYEEGILRCNKSLKLDSSLYMNYYYKGLMLVYLKRKEEAEATFKFIEELQANSEKEFLVVGIYRIYKK